MFVNPITNFNVTSNSYQNNSQGVKRMSTGGGGNLSELSADTVSFGEKMNKKQKANRLAQLGAAAALVAGGPLYTACTKDFEMSQSQSQGMWVNVENYHKCTCEPIPIIIPGGRDTIYVERPGEVVHDTIVVEKPGETIRDTIYIDKPGPTVTDTIYIDNPPDTIYIDRPGPTITDTVYVDRPVYDTIYVDRPVVDTVYVDRPVHDTIWIKPDTVYIPKDPPHFEINDSINKDIEDFDIPTEGEGNFVYAFQGRNEYLGANHLLLFNGFFSDERKSSFVDHAFEEDDIPAGGDKPSKYYYTRYDISSDYENGRRLVQVYHPRENRHQLPDDKKRGQAGWKYVGEFYVKNASVAGTAQLIANDMDGTLKSKYTKNEKRGPGNIYKEWPLNDNQMPKTTIEKVKAYKKDLGKLED